MQLAQYTGGAEVLPHYESGMHSIIMGVRTAWGAPRIQDVALLDTAASWSIMNKDIAAALRDEVELCSDPLRISSRFGVITGHLYRVEVRLLSDSDRGEDLTIPATVCVSNDWPGPSVLGFGGLLERLRFAYEPESITNAPSLWWADTDEG
jgi:hypothetical protein